jgi:hypothetical protein
LSLYTPADERAAAAMDASREGDRRRAAMAFNARELAKLLRAKARTARIRDLADMLAEADRWEERAKEHEQSTEEGT